MALSITDDDLPDVDTFDDIARNDEREDAAFVGGTVPVADPTALVRSIPAHTPTDTVYRVERTQSVSQSGQPIQLRRGQEIRLGRYGVAHLNAWITTNHLQIVVERAGTVPVQTAKDKRIANLEKARAARKTKV